MSAVELADGRRLSYGLHGASDGPLVVVLDGPGSRGLARAASGTAAELGIRLVAPDRPGFGDSTPAPQRAIAEWPADHAALLDALGAERAGVLAQSGGTPYALAAAAALPERTTAVAFLGAVAPLDDPDSLAEAGAQLRRGAKLARRAPWLLRMALRSAGRKAAKDPEKAARRVAKDAPAPDAAILAEPDMWAIHVQSTSEVLGHPDALAQEVRLVAEPWGIDLDAVRAPVAFWSGERDETHPPSHSRRLAGLLGGDAQVTVVEGAGTFGLLPRYSEALSFAAGR